MKKNALLILLLALLVSACQQTIDRNPALLGRWQGVQWLIFDKPANMDAGKVHFEFKEDGSFTAQFGDQMQSGSWRTEKDKLYTTAEDKKEIMVKLLVADGTNLNFEMNRGGQKETLQLIKEQ